MVQHPPKPEKNSAEGSQASPGAHHSEATSQKHHGQEAHNHSHDHVSKRARRFIDRAILLRIAGLCLAGSIGIGGGLALKSYLAESGADDVYGLEGKMQKLCRAKVDDLDCKCLWENAGDAFTFENTSDILEILADRRRWTGQITRARIKKVSDERSAGLISRSLYRCTLLF